MVCKKTVKSAILSIIITLLIGLCISSKVNAEGSYIIVEPSWYVNKNLSFFDGSVSDYSAANGISVCTDYIPVQGSELVFKRINPDIGQTFYICAYDSSKTFINYAFFVNTSHDSKMFNTVTIPSGASYVKIGFSDSNTVYAKNLTDTQLYEFINNTFSSIAFYSGTLSDTDYYTYSLNNSYHMELDNDSIIWYINVYHNSYYNTLSADSDKNYGLKCTTAVYDASDLNLILKDVCVDYELNPFVHSFDEHLKYLGKTNLNALENHAEFKAAVLKDGARYFRIEVNVFSNTLGAYTTQEKENFIRTNISNIYIYSGDITDDVYLKNNCSCGYYGDDGGDTGSGDSGDIGSGGGGNTGSGNSGNSGSGDSGNTGSGGSSDSGSGTDGYYTLPLNWIHDWEIDTTNGKLIVSDTSAVSSDYIAMKSGAQYYSDMLQTYYESWGVVAYYDANKNYLKYEQLFTGGPDDSTGGYYPDTTTYFTPPENAAYMRFSISCLVNDDAWMDNYMLPLFSVNYNLDSEEEYKKESLNLLEQIVYFFTNFFENLGNFLKGLVVPSADELTTFLDEVNAWFSDRLGFIWYPFDLAIDIVSALANGDSDTTFSVPALTLNMLGGEYTIFEGLEVDIDPVGIFEYVRMFTSFILVSAVTALAFYKFLQWIGGAV